MDSQFFPQFLPLAKAKTYMLGSHSHDQSATDIYLYVSAKTFPEAEGLPILNSVKVFTKTLQKTRQTCNVEIFCLVDFQSLFDLFRTSKMLFI